MTLKKKQKTLGPSVSQRPVAAFLPEKSVMWTQALTTVDARPAEHAEVSQNHEYMLKYVSTLLCWKQDDRHILLGRQPALCVELDKNELNM